VLQERLVDQEEVGEAKNEGEREDGDVAEPTEVEMPAALPRYRLDGQDAAWMFPMRAVANSDVFSTVAPSICRSKS